MTLRTDGKISLPLLGAAVIILTLLFVAYGCSEGQVSQPAQPAQEEQVQFEEVVDVIEPEPEPEPVVEEEPVIIEESYYEEPVYYNDTYEPESVVSYYEPSEGLNQFSGVNYHDGRTETYYSSNVLYHHRISEWTVDEEGFYRTDEGYYVVAASDMEQGTTFEGSKGTCIVLDTGCNEGVTDYYVNW
jgi:hypothetical protein